MIFFIWFKLLMLKPILTIFQLYHGSQLFTNKQTNNLSGNMYKGDTWMGHWEKYFIATSEWKEFLSQSGGLTACSHIQLHVHVYLKSAV